MILRSISFTFSLMFIFAFFSSQPLLAQEKEPQEAAPQKSEKSSPEEDKQKEEKKQKTEANEDKDPDKKAPEDKNPNEPEKPVQPEGPPVHAGAELIPFEQPELKKNQIYLFDGKTLNGWVQMNRKPIEKGWRVENGYLLMDKKGGTILSAEKFSDFVIEWEWAIAKGGNSGLKYRLHNYRNMGSLGIEYQMYDDLSKKIDSLHGVASIYALVPAAQDKPMKPHGEFNRSKVIANGPHIEHWLNGKLVAKATIGSKYWQNQKSKSKFGNKGWFSYNKSGYFMLQDHGAPIAIKSIVLTKLPPYQEKEEVAGVDFDKDIRPILSDKCFHCHGPDTKGQDSELRLDSLAGATADLGGYAAVVPGNIAKSELINRILSHDPDEMMPPKDSNRELSKDQKEKLKAWIQAGAKWDQHWAFEKRMQPNFKQVDDIDWIGNDLDILVRNHFDKHGITPSPEASKETLLRRLSLDLIGLPPTLEELDRFLKNKSPQAYEKEVDRLLKSPRFGEHMALEWLDAARYSDSNGYQQERTRTMWPWRDWVVRAFNKNMPFDQFSIEQLAGDLLQNASLEQKVATGLHRNHMLNGEGGRIAEESRVEYVVDRVDTTATIWMGLTMGCARCHDHKYDPISQKEFYRFYSYFNHIDESGRVDAGGNAKPLISIPTKEQTKKIAEIKQQIKELSKQLNESKSDQTFQAWQAKKREEFSKEKAEPELPSWLPATFERFTTTEKVDHKILEDGSIYISGPNPDKNEYQVELAVENLQELRTLRLETIGDVSFTHQGFARSDSGNFVLTDIKFQYSSALEKAGDKSDWKDLKVRSAKADFEQQGWPLQNALDGNPNATGWAVWTNNPKTMGTNRNAMFFFDKAVKLQPGSSLKVTMKFLSPHKYHVLGRFRFFASSQTEETLSGSKPDQGELTTLVKIDPQQRTKEQTKKLRELYEKNAERPARFKRDLDNANQRLKGIEGSIVKSMVMQERATPRETYLLKRGAWDNPDKSEKLFSDVPQGIFPADKNLPKSRLGLAKWLMHPDHPLTARVTVNRIWQHFFGVGIVKTSEDFGTQGERPSHPEILDWLANDFVKNKWNLKRLVKTIVMSSTYKQSSKISEEQFEKDPHNRLLARGGRYRLSSLAIRDQALMLSGLLVEKMGGPPVYPYHPLGIWSDLTLGKIKYQRQSGENLYRRSLYTFWRRSVAPTMFFDSASRQVCVVKQNRTNTPLHALTLMNDITYVEAARAFAERMLKEKKLDTPAKRLTQAFRMATSRHATEQEAKVLVELYENLLTKFTEDEQAAKELLSTGESKRDESLPLAEHAAMTGTLNALLNLDEVITRE